LASFDSVTKDNLPSHKSRCAKPAFNLQNELCRVAGVDLTKINGIDTTTTLKIVSETGFDMSRWKSAKHFASWLGLSPGSKISGGNRLSGKTKPVVNRAAMALRMAASSLYRSNCALALIIGE
jgi:transposase